MKNKLHSLYKRLVSVEYTPRHARLAGDIASYKPILEKRIAENGGDTTNWAKQARILIEKAEGFLAKMRIDEGWKAFHTAKRLEVNGMSDEERTAIARELQVESVKLNDWRKDAILRMLGSEEKPGPMPPAPEVLIRAMEIKDEHFNNQYYKNTLSKSMFQLLFFLLFVFIVAIVIYFHVLQFNYGEDWAARLNIAGYMVGVLLFGFLGSITSAILFTRYSTQFSRLTEIGSTSVITLSKIFVGAAFSVFIFVILKSSVAGSLQIFNFSIDDPMDYFAIAYISGFSERLAQKAIETIVGKEK